MEFLGYAAERTFQRPHDLDSKAFLLRDAVKRFGDLGLSGLDVLQVAVEAGGRRSTVALHALDAGEHAHHLLVDAGDGEGGAILGRLHPLGQDVEGAPDPLQLGVGG